MTFIQNTIMSIPLLWIECQYLFLRFYKFFGRFVTVHSPKKAIVKNAENNFFILWIIQLNREHHVDNVPCCFFRILIHRKKSPHRNRNLVQTRYLKHFPSTQGHTFPPGNDTYPRSKCQYGYSDRFAFFGVLCYTLMEREGYDMENARNRDPSAIYEDLVAALEAQVKKQEEIIQIQDETIQALRKHNEELSAFLDYYYERH